MTNTINNVPRELLDSLLTVIESNGYAADEVEVVDELRVLLSATSPADVDGLEVVGHIDSDDDVSGSYAVFRNDCDLRDGTELVRLSDAMRAIARIQDECELLMNFKIAYNEWQDKTEWVQQTATVKELGKHRADVLKDRLSGWIARMNQPYDDADLGN